MVTTDNNRQNRFTLPLAHARGVTQLGIRYMCAERTGFMKRKIELLLIATDLQDTGAMALDALMVMITLSNLLFRCMCICHGTKLI